jgi:exopolysaccharide biosynthesis polyprenyl glycosylphosphotransferase
MLSRASWKWGLALFAADLTVAAGCFVVALYLKKQVIFADPFLDTDAFLRLFKLEAPFVMLVLVVNGLYAKQNLVKGVGWQVLRAIRAAIYVVPVFLAVCFCAKIFPYPPSRAVFILFFCLLPLGLILLRLVAAVCASLWRPSGGGSRRILLAGEEAASRNLLRKLKSNPYLDARITPMRCDREQRIQEVLDEIEQENLRCVIIDLPLKKLSTIIRIVRRADEEGVPAYVTPTVIPNTMLQLSWQEIGGVPLIAFRPTDLPPVGMVVKRTMDIVGALAGLIVLSPLMLCIAVLVKATSRGPVIFRQKRVGIDGEPFTILKFRTMKTDAEQRTGPVWADDDDRRCTSIGSFLRRSDLDELPQLFNVLMGSMSLVGPRPERPEFVQEFREEVDRYLHKHWVKPGITGWAQANGWRGKTDLEERIRHDLYYIDNWSIWLDLRIITLTLVRVFHDFAAAVRRERAGATEPISARPAVSNTDDLA